MEFPQPKSAALSIKIKPAVKKKNRRLFTVRLLIYRDLALLSFSPSMRAVLFAAAKTQYGRLCTDDRFRKADKKALKS